MGVFFLQLDRVSRFSGRLCCILNSAELLQLWWPCDIGVLHCKGLRRDLVSPKVDCARFQCAGFCCGCRNEELKLWSQQHTTAAMAFCADHACAGHKRPTSQPSGCVAHTGLPQPVCQFEGQHTAGSRLFHAETEPEQPPYSCYPRQDQIWNTFNNPGAINSLLYMCLKSGKYLKYERGKGGV